MQLGVRNLALVLEFGRPLNTDAALELCEKWGQTHPSCVKKCAETALQSAFYGPSLCVGHWARYPMRDALVELPKDDPVVL